MRRTFTWVAALAALFVCAGASAQGKQWTKVRIATEGAYAPWNFMDAGGKLAGFEVELAAELCKRAKVECEVVAQDWDGIIPALRGGKYDAIMAGMNITDKRLEAIDFTQPYGSTPHSLAVLKSSPLAKLPGTGETYSMTTNRAEAEKALAAMKPLLKGKIIGAQVSTTNAAFVEEYFKDVAEIRHYKTTEQHDLDLAAGRIDAAIAANSVWNDVLSKPAGKDMMIAGPGFRGGVLGRGVAVGIRKNEPELQKLFDDAITQVKADGTLKTLSMKWFKLDITPQ